jgi:hypothetical protein
VEKQVKSVIRLKREFSLFSMILLSLLLVLSWSTNVLAEDTNTSNGTSTGVIVQSVVTKEADAKATQKTEEDPVVLFMIGQTIVL